MTLFILIKVLRYNKYMGYDYLNISVHTNTFKTDDCLMFYLFDYIKLSADLYESEPAASIKCAVHVLKELHSELSGSACYMCFTALKGVAIIIFKCIINSFIKYVYNNIYYSLDPFALNSLFKRDTRHSIKYLANDSFERCENILDFIAELRKTPDAQRKELFYIIYLVTIYIPITERNSKFYSFIKKTLNDIDISLFTFDLN
ncbi:hypothetical protein AGLY_007530 [Aphis glycines]|uniref:Uncharacterized protein n=1 Tax=Aphis glycines TaxID=307491 RepID=A0A6G0TMC5_APHGL|nr:hypothetical protein AGLY_007530 [Aphis glycines]